MSNNTNSMMNNVMALTPSEIYSRLEVAVQTDVVPYIQSSPGMGKSSLVRQLAEEHNLFLIDIRASQYEPMDFSGLPTRREDGEKAEYLPFDVLPIDGDPVPEGYDGFLLFLDEINHARQPVMAALYKLILDKKVGNKDLHKKVRMVAAGNMDSDKANTIRMGSAFNSRVMHMVMKPSLENWMDNFAVKAGIDDRILSYLLQFPDEFYKFDPDSAHKSFNCARSWHMVDQLIKGAANLGKSSKNNDDLDIHMFDGLLSPGVASKFVGYCDVFGAIPSITDVLTDPKNARVPEGNDACFATAVSMASNTTDKCVSQVCEYMGKLPKIHQAIYATMVTRHDYRLSTNRAVVQLTTATMK